MDFFLQLMRILFRERRMKKVKTTLVFAVLAGYLSGMVSCRQATEQPAVTELERFQLISEIKHDNNSPFYIDFENYPVERNNLPIGVFDSGTGGLTVLDAILRMDRFDNQTHEPGSDGIPDFTSERFIYLADQANMPYGRYDSEGKSDFLKELVVKDVQFLLGDKYYTSPEDELPQTDKPPVKAIVIACNTATAYGLDLIQDAIKEWGVDVKVIGIIDAGALTAVSSPQQEEKARLIGVIATEGTCASEGYPAAVGEHFTRLYDGSVRVVQQAGFGLAGAIDGDLSYIDPEAMEVRGSAVYQGPGLYHPIYPIEPELFQEYSFEKGKGLLLKEDEEGNIVSIELNSVTNYIKYYVTHLVVKVLQEYPERTMDAVILGCTHYPFFEKEIMDHFQYLRGLDAKYAAVIPENIKLVDPALSEALELYEHLKEHELFGSSSYTDSDFYISVPNPLLPQNIINERGEFPVEYKYARSINRSLLFVKRVPLSDRWMGEDVLERIRIKMPEIYNVIFKVASLE
jgi:glutamate racemase